MKKQNGFTKIMAVFLIALPFLATVCVIYQDLLTLYLGLAKARILAKSTIRNGTHTSSSHTDSADLPIDKLLGGLLAPGFNEQSCLSRYQSAFYHKSSPDKPSPHLISRLRSYEKLHKQCGPHTESYNKTVEQLESGQNSSSPAECKYVVWMAYSGLGNRILTIATAFLYALLTNRILLVDQGTDTADLFCEPFPDTSWLLPQDFPILDKFKSFNKDSPHRHGNMIRNNLINNSADLSPPFLYIHLPYKPDYHDHRFYCDQEQTFLQNVPWLILKADNYFVPYLFLNPSFEQELAELFPNKETVFHYLGRYLFHPSNQVWGLITRYYHAYLARADEMLGIQIRTHYLGHDALEQVLSCTLQQKLLPEVNTSESVEVPSRNQKLKAVLMTSLNSGYLENITTTYRAHPTVTGEVVAVYQPSHEENQRLGDGEHEMKAWTEMYLLSFSDVLVTTAWSTFGYVAQSLGGLRPWILYKPENGKSPNPPCGRAMSMEPCFHTPPLHDCKGTRRFAGSIAPHVKQCEDVNLGVKLVNYDSV